MSLNRFNKAALHYDQHAAVQKKVAKHLCTIVKSSATPCQSVLDFGCGTGFLLKKLPSSLQLTGVEYCEGFLEISRKTLPRSVHLVPKLECLNTQFDFIISNLSFQWLPNFRHLMTTLHYWLKPQGQLIFTTVLPTSFKKLEAALVSAKLPSDLAVFDFPSFMHISKVVSEKFTAQNIRTFKESIVFEKSLELLRHFKYTGTQGNKNTGIWTPQALKRLDIAFNKLSYRPILDYDIGLWHIEKKHCLLQEQTQILEKPILQNV